MQKVILYIQPQIVNSASSSSFERVDLMEEELITLTQVIQDVKDIEKLFTDYSKTFNLPASKTNNKIFKYWFNPDVNSFNSQIFSSARIELNHFEFKTGKIQLNEVVMADQKPSMYKVTFFGETADFKNSISEEQLSDLTFLNAFNHEFIKSNVETGMGDGIDFVVDGVNYDSIIKYPLITCRHNYTYSTTNVTSPFNIRYRTVSQQGGISIHDLKPSIGIKTILEAIERQYSIKFKSGEFFDSTVMDNLFMWLHREKGQMTVRKSKLMFGANYPFVFLCMDYESTSISGSVNPDCQALTDPDFGDNRLFRGWFEANQSGGNPEGGIFNFLPDMSQDFEETKFKLIVTVQSAFANIPYTMEIIRLNDMQVFARSENNVGDNELEIVMFTDPNSPNSPTGNRLNRVDLFNFSQAQGSGAGNGTPSRFVARITAEEEIQAAAVYDIDRTYINTMGGFTTTTNIKGRMNQFLFAIIDTDFIFIPDQMPKLKVKDFLNGLFRQFNLIAYLDYFGEITVKTLDDYYANGEVQDITKYIKTDSHTIGDTLPFSEIDLTYKSPKSILAQNFTQVNNQDYGSLNYETTVSKKKNYKIELPFEQMLFERLNDTGATSFTPTDIQYGTFINEELEPSIGAPLLFYGIRVTQTPALGFNLALTSRNRDEETGDFPALVTTFNRITQFTIPSVCNSTGTPSTPPTHNLNFGSEINTYQLTDYSGNNNSLFQTYYENYVTRVFNTRTRLFKIDAVLPLQVLLSISLDDTLIIKDRAFTINKMTTKLQSGETSFELLNEPSNLETSGSDSGNTNDSDNTDNSENENDTSG